MTVILTINESGPPKQDIIELAFEECGSSGYVFGRTPEEIGSALRKLDMMMAELSVSGVEIGYAQPETGVSEAGDLSGIPLSAVNAVALMLALRIAPAMGKTLSPEARANIARSMLLLRSVTATPATAYMAPGTPRGAGGRNRAPFIDDRPRTEEEVLLTVDPGDLAGIVEGG